MTAGPAPKPVRRITLAVDASTDNAATVAAASRLAARLHAELEAVFIEDLDLLHSAALPFVREISTLAPASQAFSRAATERTLRLLARETRAAVERHAERADVAWRFRVVRGRLSQTVPAAARKADLVIVGGPGRAVTRHFKTPAGPRSAATLCGTPVLMLNREQAMRGPFVALYAARTGERALAAASLLATAEGSTISVLIAADSPAEAERLETEARAWLASHDAGEAAVARLPAAALTGLCQALAAVGGGTAVISVDSPLLQSDEAFRTLDRTGCAVLLVR